MNTILSILGYQITEQLYLGTRTIVYRGLRESDQAPVVIKLLRNEYPTFNEIVQFCNQYTIAKNISFTHIIKTLTLEPYRNSYILVMEDFQGISLSDYLKIGIEQNQKHTSLPLIEFFNIAIQLADILNYLYQNRIIHKDIKPANILINPASKKVKLIDFSIASLLPRETQEIENPKVLEGTLTYISPEQTGRMNRGIDYRSDFYSLGITFYELLIGVLPFDSEDAMELVHCHLAKQATPIHQINSKIPLVLSEIVSKLMAKNAEDRYQSALGLKQDLEICLAQLVATGKIEYFEIGKRDISDRFTIPEKLYGRETEVTQLLAAFERVCTGSTEIMLVAGFSGIGKTAVVNEVHKPIVRQRGYFIKGKYDQFQRNLPFSAFVQAFRDLMRQLLSESNLQLQIWKTEILVALGDNGQVLIDVIPELENIIGKQPKAPELSGSAAQNRFNLLMQKFVQVFINAKHPLVIFLDDLQWADSASLNLLKLLVQDKRYLLILGAYRDNEVSSVHPFILTVDEISKNGVTVNSITLPSLSESDVNWLVADTLNCTLSLAEPLTKLIYQKTNGNPFFATQFLKALHQDQLITFDGKSRHWQCDIAQVKALAITDNVMEFMALQLQKLPTETQNILKLAACIGAEFDLNTLVIVSEKSAVITARLLWKALQENLVIPTTKIYKFFTQTESEEAFPDSVNPTYRFLHDRVQQASYSLIPDEQKQHTHYQIGQLLLQQISSEEREERIFELVNQLNYGISLITKQTERNELVELNLIACRKARTATAYQAAREYALVGLSLLGENAWQQQYEMTLAFHEAAAEVAYLCGDFQQMEELIKTVTHQTHSLLEQVNIYRLRIQANAARNQLVEALAIGQQFLEQLGIILTESSTSLEQVTEEIRRLIGDRQIAEFVDLPIMTDQTKLVIVQVANSMVPSALVTGSYLYPLLTSLSVNLSIQYGNTSMTAYSYVSYGMMLCNTLQDIDRGTQFGQLALRVNSKLENKTIKSQILHVLGMFILHRKLHIKETLSVLQDAYITSLEVGNLGYAGYAAQIFCINSFWSSQDLVFLEQDAKAYCNQLVKLNLLTTSNYCRICWQTILNLLGFGENPCVLSGENCFQETEFLHGLLAGKDLYGLYFFYLHKLTLCFWFEEIELAKLYRIECRKYLRAGAGTVGEPAFYFYDSLIALAQLNLDLDPAVEILERVAQNELQLQQYWAHYAPMNHQHKVDLLRAEKYRVLGKNHEAIDHYNRAIAIAKKNQYIQEEALANELAAKFYLAVGQEKFATKYMQEAYYCYARWGAKAKVAHLEQKYPELLNTILQHDGNMITHGVTVNSTLMRGLISTTSTDNLWLDFPGVMRAAQAISQEIELDQLLATLMNIAIAHAGAQIGCLVLRQDEQWFVVAQTAKKHTNILEISLEQYQEIPHSLIYTVARTQETAVFDNLSTTPQFAHDRYVITYQPKSALGIPISKRGKVMGILYLENNLTVGAFTSERVNILQLLAAQAAISIQNARLYKQIESYSQTLESEVARKTEALNQKAFDLEQTLINLQQTQAQLIQSEKMSSLGQLVAGIAHEINNPVTFISGNIKHTENYIKNLLSLLELYQQEYPETNPVIQAKIQEIELEFIWSDATNILQSMKAGSDRISQIILSLRNFSRLDESEMKEVDLHSGIDSTLLILQNRLNRDGGRPAIQVIKEYGDLPNVTCYASQLNQVFLNIISNGIDAIEEISQPGKDPLIRIQTEVIGKDRVRIAIADNGMGIPPEIQSRIFDPFFTTKAVGSGTGLGLSVSYAIIKKHDGQLTCNSTIGKGTEIAIEIPIHHR